MLSMKQHQKYFPAAGQEHRQAAQSLPHRQQPRRRRSEEHHRRQRASATRALVGRKVLFRSRSQDPAGDPCAATRRGRLSQQTGQPARARATHPEACERHCGEARCQHPNNAERAAWLSKADLTHRHGRRVPGTAGHDGSILCASRRRGRGGGARHRGALSPALRRRYRCPKTTSAAAVALADKLDTLVGIYGIGLVPTGDKDPFGLRRQALGVLRILSERALPLDLLELLQLAKLSFPDRSAGRQRSG